MTIIVATTSGGPSVTTVELPGRAIEPGLRLHDRSDGHHHRPRTADGDDIARRYGLAAWTDQLGLPGPESRRSLRLAHLGGIASVVALVMYLTWRIGWTLPHAGGSRWVAYVLVAFEALPVMGLMMKAVTLWDTSSTTPVPYTEMRHPPTVVVMIPTYNEPLEVVAPTIAAACALQPAHETWVLDDGDRSWLAELCERWGARYVSRPVHDHAKAGNLNHALGLLTAEREAGHGGADVVAVLDCDHVPLPHFLIATLGWFEDEHVALVQGPQAFYNGGAFDDDGSSGEQGLFFNVLMPARNHAGAGPFWCGSSSLLRTSALDDVGGVATETITEDMHTTLKLIRKGWRTVYHHQTLAIGLAPATPEQYLLQRRRWGMGAMQILAHERLWAAKRWLGWRNFYEYLTGTLWWLEGISTMVAILVPIAVLLSGAETSTASPLTFTVAFLAMFTVRLWGSKRLLRGQIHWRTAFALRVFRVPVGLACLWWLVSRRTLEFEVTPKGAVDERLRGRTPNVLWFVLATVVVVLTTAALGIAGVLPGRASTGSAVASGMWLAVTGLVLIVGMRRIRAARYASSRRNAYRVRIDLPVTIDGEPATLVDVSMGGAAVALPVGSAELSGTVEVGLPGAAPIEMIVVRNGSGADGRCVVSLHIGTGDASCLRTLALWMFHTPAGSIAGLPPGVPIIACTRPVD